MKQTGRVSARAIIIDDDKLLVMQRNKFGDEYYTLVGGAVEPGETPEQAVKREVLEETSLKVTSCRLVFIEAPDVRFGTQYIFLCDSAGGQVHLPQGSPEAKINAMGQNLYQPMWLELSDLPAANFLSEQLKQAILDGVKNGFPAEPVRISRGA